MTYFKPLPLLLLTLAIALGGCQLLYTQTDSLLSRSVQAQSKLVEVVNVHDGDTIRVSLNGKQERIRLCGIDAPELKQRLGESSRDNLRSLVNQANNRVRITVVDVDRYGREVAEVSSPTGKVFNVEQIRSGNAYFYRQYASKCPHGAQLEQAEATAQKLKQGVWKYPNALKPWEYRKKQRQSA
ncbi:thermonuclease family protein [Leptolyngbya ohadii]|uniref:thermonuclease family protein n=1 Tax=Leptolyngbya ohadii TaxID=1962290 RepID=UPI000B598EB2|nr:thermonuclease family protein [Leptolyngbya ohadii]